MEQEMVGDEPKQWGGKRPGAGRPAGTGKGGKGKQGAAVWVPGTEAEVAFIKSLPSEERRKRLLGEVTMYELAKVRVEGSEVLNAHASTILYDWNEGDEHWRWVAAADESEIVDWAEAIEAQKN